MNTNDKVVCVSDPMEFWNNGRRIEGDVPKVGVVYCVTGVIAPYRGEDMRISLVGSTTYLRKRGEEFGWHAKCFRPVGSDISLIRAA